MLLLLTRMLQSLVLKKSFDRFRQDIGEDISTRCTLQGMCWSMVQEKRKTRSQIHSDSLNRRPNLNGTGRQFWQDLMPNHTDKYICITGLFVELFENKLCQLIQLPADKEPLFDRAPLRWHPSLLPPDTQFTEAFR